MIVETKCDRCKKPMDTKTTACVRVDILQWLPSLRKPDGVGIGFGNQTRASWDLCPKCSARLEDWFLRGDSFAEQLAAAKAAG